VTASEGNGGNHDFIHSEKLVLIDRHLRLRGYYIGTADKDVLQLIQDIKKLQDEK
jgi:protein SCO1/2